MKILISLFLLLFSTLIFASSDSVLKMAHELQKVSGKFELLSIESQSKLASFPTEELSAHIIENSLEIMDKEMDQGEVFVKLHDSTVGIYNEMSELEGFIVIPVTFLAVPEGDTDYYVYYYSFYSIESGKEKFETQFKVFSPLY